MQWDAVTVADKGFAVGKMIGCTMAGRLEIRAIARGGAILVRDKKLFHSMEDLIPMFEGFLTYGGMDVRTIESVTEGLYESLDMDYELLKSKNIFICGKCLDFDK